MKISLTFEGNIFEDSDTIKILTHAVDIYSANSDAKNEIRSRLKHASGVTDSEEHFLERLLELLYIEGVE